MMKSSASAPTNDNGNENENESTTLSEKYAALEGTGPEPYAAFQALKERIKLHYDVASDYYLSLWGEHIHHGYFTSPTQTKEDAQVALINLLLDISSAVPRQMASNDNGNGNGNGNGNDTPHLRIIDVGCGLGGTSRHLAREYGAHVTGITISSKQVDIARRLSRRDAHANADNNINADNADDDDDAEAAIPVGSRGGTVRFIELDAEKMGDYFCSPASSASLSPPLSSSPSQPPPKPQQQSPSNNKNDNDTSPSTNATTDTTFDVVWISEALSHFPNKPLFFQNAARVLRPNNSNSNSNSSSSNGGTSGGKLVLADWFKNDDLTDRQFLDDIRPIEEGMLLPPLCTAREYVVMAEAAGLKVCDGGVRDISREVAKTWDISWSLVQNPSLWAFAFSQGRDGLAFLQAFRAMRRGYANGTFRYAVMAFEK